MFATPRKAIIIASALAIVITSSLAFRYISVNNKRLLSNEHIHCTPEHHVCVMKTIFGLEDTGSIAYSIEKLPAEVKASVTSSLSWLSKAQGADGGWGAGFHAHQEVSDPHAVPSDPATTSIVALSLLRTGNTLSQGEYKEQLTNATDFLLTQVEKWPKDQPKLTTLEATQPQVKLGQNIDAILTVQYFTNLLKVQKQHPISGRIESALKKCVARIEQEQDTDGGWKGGGWAPVLQSALADNALEAAQDAGIQVDTAVLYKSKNYQKGNYDVATNSAVTGKAAGVMLYSLSSTTRSSAKEAAKVKKTVEEGIKEGKIRVDDKVNEQTLVKAGVAPAQAKEMMTAYMINQSAKGQSTQADVMNGFGSNGGEELISYFMTGESIQMQNDPAEWKKWYDMMSKKIVSIQQQDGSWQGHHCITSPVFCTAAALLILSVNNEVNVNF